MSFKASMDKYRGCLVGGAVGDALGYPVEFKSYEEIIAKYGEDGITRYRKRNGRALISDDTQMTMYTANGLMLGATRAVLRGINGPWRIYVAKAYEEWYKTQSSKGKAMLEDKDYSFWISGLSELYTDRAPGNTCLRALASGHLGTVDKPCNHSKGCGGVMRVAPAGLFAPFTFGGVESSLELGADLAALTHGHELGYLPAAALAYLISLLVTQKHIRLEEAVRATLKELQRKYGDKRHLPELIALLDKAVRLSQERLRDEEAIRQLGQGWVAEEALAIALYCALKHSNSFERAVVAAVNHSGDSDSTGAICGNIIGAYLGFSQIPGKFLVDLELLEPLIQLADDMADLGEDRFEDEDWEDRYVYAGHRRKNG